MKVAFIHPDLGLGGAERWLVDSALALQSLGHEVEIFTAHYNINRCFDETRTQLKVRCHGDWLPRSLFGKFVALCAYIRMIYLSFYLVFFLKCVPNVIICDQVSACIPVLRYSKSKIVFYCHFPDLLLSKRESVVKSLYRKPLDSLEEYTTGLADSILVNSKFTMGIFRETFKSLSEKQVSVLYPSINTKVFDEIKPDKEKLFFYNPGHKYILSLNRFERKKNVHLALEAFAELKSILSSEEFKRLTLVIAGGHDPRVPENVEHFAELEESCKKYGLIDQTIFVPSPNDDQKVTLLSMCEVLLYTPSNEHFGIVPVEAMYVRTPVVAVNSGGPLESVADGVTGYLREPTAEAFADAIATILRDDNLRRSMGDAGHDRVCNNFSFESFAQRLQSFVM